MEHNMIAHQFKIRELKKEEEKNKLPFDIDQIDLNKTIVKEIDRLTAKKIIEEYEWLGTLGSFNKYYFGIFFKINDQEYLGGVVVYSNEYVMNTGIWEKYGFDDKIILLSRGTCLWWTPKNTASYFISKTINWIKNNTKYRIITATVDPEAGEIGTIYQSLNWKYVGLLSGNYSKSGKELVRYSVLINGKLRTTRSIRREIGSMKKDDVLKKYPDAVFIPKFRKRRYFYFIDKKYEKSIQNIILPYPKRNINHISGLIYMIKNKINGKIYIGQTIRPLHDRIEDYKRGLGNNYLNNSFKLYGFENFEFSIIETSTSINELNNREIFWINHYDSTNKSIGYNIEIGGKNSIASNETRKKMSLVHKGKKQTEEWINKRVAKAGSDDAKKYGKAKTEEEKKQIAERSPKFWLGKTRDQETREKISKTKKEQGLLPPNTKKVVGYNIITKQESIYNSTTEAARINPEYTQSTISRICNGKSKNKKHIIWRFAA